MELWKKVFVKGIAPLLTSTQLRRLRQGLSIDDERLLQGATSCPPPMQCVLDWPCEGACALGYAGWERDSTVGEVEEFFAKICFQADQRLGEPAAVRYFLNWFDDTPRDRVRRELIPVIDNIIKERLDG